MYTEMTLQEYLHKTEPLPHYHMVKGVLKRFKTEGVKINTKDTTIVLGDTTFMIIYNVDLLLFWWDVTEDTNPRIRQKIGVTDEVPVWGCLNTREVIMKYGRDAVDTYLKAHESQNKKTKES